VQADTDVRRREQLGATSAVQRKANFVIAVDGIACEAEHPGRERADARAAELLQRPTKPVIDRDPLDGDRTAARQKSGDAAFLMCKEGLELKAILKRDVERHAHRGRTVEVNRMPRDELEKVAPEAVAIEGRHFDTLREQAWRGTSQGYQKRYRRCA